MSKDSLDGQATANPYDTSGLEHGAPTSVGDPLGPREFSMAPRIEKQLLAAWWALISVGVLTASHYSLLLLDVSADTDGRGLPEPVATVQNAVYGLGLGLGALFVGLALWLKRYPLFCSLTGLGLYIVSHLLVALVDPGTISRQAVIKIIVILALSLAVRAGLAHRQHQRQAFHHVPH